MSQAEKRLPRASKGLKPTSLARERESSQSRAVPDYGPDFRRLRGDLQQSGRTNNQEVAITAISGGVSTSLGDGRRESRPVEPLDRGAILERILASIRYRLDQPFDAVRAQLIVRCTTIGRGVEIEREDQKPLVGLAVGLDPDGALQVQVGGDRVERCDSGRVRELPSV